MNNFNHNRYVAHFDMLGFKNAVIRNPNEAWGALSDFNQCMEELLNSTVIISSFNKSISDRIQTKIFSDTVLIHSLSDETDDLISIIVLISRFFFNSLKKCVPIRGAITYGEFFFNPHKNLYLGIPWIKAHEMGESAQWNGIIVQDEVANRFKNLPANIFEAKDMIIKWDVIFKKSNKLSKENVNVINWPAMVKNYNFRIPIKVTDYYQAFESLFGPYDNLSDDIKNKYINTTDFINANLR